MNSPATFLLLATFLIEPFKGYAADTCIDMYKTAFKGHTKIAPGEVGQLYRTYCKKNMRVSSAKSMDELCLPLVKKVEDKMLWVPATTEMTPEIVCKSVDQLKKDFPEHATSMLMEQEGKLKESRAAQAAKDELSKKAKELSTGIGASVQGALAKVTSELTAKLKEDMENHMNRIVGDDANQDRKAKLVSTILESVSLGLRGIETKVNQKKDEALKSWLSGELKDLQQKAKTKEAAAAKKEL